MKIHAHLILFIESLSRDYGHPDPVIKIGVTPGLLQDLMIEAAKEKTHIGNGWRITDFSEFEIHGVKFVAREKDDF